MRRRQACGVISKQEELVQSKSQPLVCTECPDSITSLDPAYITLQSQLRDTSSSSGDSDR